MTVYATLMDELMDHRRSDMWLMLGLAIAGCSVVSACWPHLLHASTQSQEAINAVNQERFSEIFRRLDSIESLTKGGVVLLISNLIAMVVQIWNQRQQRRKF